VGSSWKRRQVELNDVTGAVRRHWRLVAASVLLGLVVAALLSWVTPKTYQSTTQLFVTTAGNPSNPTDPYNADLFSQQRIVSYVQILTGKELAQIVVDQLELDESAEELADKVTATPLPDTVVLEVTVTDSSPERAQAIAVGVGRAFTDYVTALETPAGVTASNVKVSTIQAADLVTDPATPNVARNLALGAVLGLVLGFSLALIRQRTDRSIRNRADISAAAGVDPVAWVREDPDLRRSHVLVKTSAPATVESFRALRLNVEHLGRGSRPKVFVLASALPGQGTTTVAVNVAISLARSGSRVLLVDGDLRRPRIARYLSMAEDGPGLSDVLRGDVEFGAAVRTWQGGPLVVLGAGSTVDSDEALSQPRLEALFATMRETYDVVIIDGPPLLSVVDAAAIAASADGCLLVARFAAKRDELTDAAAVLERIGVRPLGVVVNRVPRSASSSPARGHDYVPDADRRGSARVPRPASADPVTASQSRPADSSTHMQESVRTPGEGSSS
jgi:succinoglycan biosynthesis transport protein ExoP